MVQRPNATPVMRPEELTVQTAVLPDVYVPPVAAWVVLSTLAMIGESWRVAVGAITASLGETRSSIAVPAVLANVTCCSHWQNGYPADVPEPPCRSRGSTVIVCRPFGNIVVFNEITQLVRVWFVWLNTLTSPSTRAYSVF